MPNIKDMIWFSLSIVASKLIEDHLPSLHYTNIIAGLKKLLAYILSIIFILLVRAKVIKISNTALIALVAIGMILVIAAKFNKEQKKLKTAIA